MITKRLMWEDKRRISLLTALLFLCAGLSPAFAKQPTDLIVANTSDNTISVFINEVQGNAHSFTHLLPDLPAGNTPAYIGVGYFNEDRLPDLVVVNPDVPQLVFFLGQKKGPFVQVPETYPINVPIGPNLAVSDFNLDGLDDILVSLQNGEVEVLLSKKIKGCADKDRLNFKKSYRVLIGNRANAAAAADFNNDGNMDAVVCDFNGNTSVVMIGDSDGNGILSTTQTLPTGERPESVAIADFNNDGNADFAIAGGMSQYTSVYLGNGDGSFQSEIQVWTRNGGDGTYNVAAGDLNDDGYDDLVTRGGPDNLGQNFLSVQLWNPATTSFVSAGSVVSNAWFVGMSIVDFNHDGNQDVIFSDAPIANSFSVYYGDGAGNLALGLPPIPTGNLPGAITVVDLPNVMWKNKK